MTPTALSPVPVAAPTDADHPNTTPAKRIVLETSPTNQNKLLRTHPCLYSLSWFRLFFLLATDWFPKAPHQTQQTIPSERTLYRFKPSPFNVASWPLSLHPILVAVKYPPPNNRSIFPTSMHIFKLYLKDSTIISLLKGWPSEYPILHTQGQHFLSWLFSKKLHLHILATKQKWIQSL